MLSICTQSDTHARGYSTESLARWVLGIRRRIEALLEAYRERLLPFMPGQTREERLAKFRLLFPSMAGVLTMARVISIPERRELMLMEARACFINRFCLKSGTYV